MSPRKILTVFGTRPEAIKLFPLIHALEADVRFASRVCVSGQHRGMLDQVLEIAGVAPDHDLDLMRPDQTLDALTAGLLTGIGRVLDAEKPDWVIVQGDTATAMAGALAAYYRKIPVAHVEAGLRSGDILHPQSLLAFPLRSQAMLCVAALAIVLVARSPVAAARQAKDAP
jgi:UDP-N-acetylglucosamine 2-epimerase (non-hydrolysing)